MATACRYAPAPCLLPIPSPSVDLRRDCVWLLRFIRIVVKAVPCGVWCVVCACQSVLVAIVVPDAEHVKVWAAENGLSGSRMADWVTQDKLQKAVEADMLRCAKEARVRVVRMAAMCEHTSTRWHVSTLSVSNTPPFCVAAARLRECEGGQAHRGTVHFGK